MRRFVTLAVLTAALITPASAGAITNGTADGNRHPSVGGLVSPTQYSDGTWIYCSGTLISPTVFLTAAHCATDGELSRSRSTPPMRRVTPSTRGRSRPTRSTTSRRATRTTSPSSSSTAPCAASRPPGSRRRLALEPLGHQQFTSVGYGAYEVTNGPGGHQYLYDDVRMVATGTLNATTKSWLRISMNPSTGNGGTCYGDSGGPNFLGTTEHRRRDHDHRGRDLPLDQRGLPPRHRVGPDLPLAVRRATALAGHGTTIGLTLPGSSRPT